MEKHNKIFWKKGLDITPEIFAGSDNYHIAERSLLGRFFAFRLYGIFPGKNFYIRKRIDINTNTLIIDELECLAITRDGYVINIQRAAPYNKELSLKEVIGSELYIVLSVNPYSLSQSDEEELYVYPEYKLVTKRIEDTIEKGIPVLKIIYDHEYQYWKIDENYIPPSIALDSVDLLRQQYLNIKEKINKIIEKLPEEDNVFIQAMLLKFEFDNYCFQESPQELVLLLQKICCILKLYLKTAKNIMTLPSIKRFFEEQYNHNEIGKLLYLGFECLEEIDQKIDEKPVEKPVDIPEIIV